MTLFVVEKVMIHWYLAMVKVLYMEMEAMINLFLEIVAVTIEI